MRLVKRKANISFGPLGFQDHCASSDISRMWRYSTPAFRVPVYGPQRAHKTLRDDDLKCAYSILVKSVRNLCIYKLKRMDMPDVVVRRVEHVEHESPLQQLASRFYFKDTRSICQFLNNHSSLIPVLFQVREKFDLYFGRQALSDLELFIDPEDDNGEAKLFALILTTLSSEDATTLLTQLDEEWWLDQPYEVKLIMNIDVEYVDATI